MIVLDRKIICIDTDFFSGQDEDMRKLRTELTLSQQWVCTMVGWVADPEEK